MDAKDFQLLVALFEDPRQGYRSLGKRVSLSHPVVRERLGNLKRRGILQGFFLSINPQALGREDLLVRFDGDWTREDAEMALAVPGVAWVAWKLNGNLTVQVWPHDRDRAMENLKDALGVNPSGHFLAEPNSSFHSPSLADWRIIDALIDNPMRPLDSLVAATGLSPKTVRNHLNALLKERTIHISPRLGSLADAGELVYTVSVFGNVGMAELRGVTGDVYMIKEFQHPPAKHLLCRARDLSEVLGKTRALGKIPGAMVSVSLNREQLIATRSIHSLVRQQIRRLSRNRSQS